MLLYGRRWPENPNEIFSVSFNFEYMCQKVILVPDPVETESRRAMGSLENREAQVYRSVT